MKDLNTDNYTYTFGSGVKEEKPGKFFASLKRGGIIRIKAPEGYGTKGKSSE